MNSPGKGNNRKPRQDVLRDFLEYVYSGDQEGFTEVALFKDNKPSGRLWARIPEDLGKITEKFVRQHSLAGDVYFTPALFRSRKRTLEFCVGSQVAWVDQDGPQRTAEEGSRPAVLPAPGLVVASGSPGRSHRYWRSESFLGAGSTLGATNRKLAQIYGADKSGVDPTQLLRLPGSLNHKHNPPKPVEILENVGGVFDLSRFRLNPTDLEMIQIESASVSLERWSELSEYARLLATTPAQEGTRSDKLFELACRVIEEGFSTEEARTIVEDADQLFGKYVGRADRVEQLDTVVRRAQERTTPVITIVESQPDKQGIDWNQPVGLRTLLTKSPRLDWIIDGVLHKQGLMYIAGPPGVGKTTLAINLGLTIALSRKRWLDFDIEQREAQEKILVASHEMSSAELVEFLGPMTSSFSEVEFEHLEENFQTRAKGQAVPLDDEKNQRQYEIALSGGGFTGFILDTLGASTKTSLQDEQNARKIADWLARIQQRFGVWVIGVAHPRKPPAGQKRQYSTDEMYGSRIFADRASSVFIMDSTKSGTSLRAVKTRFKGGADTLYLKRNTDHWFEKTTASAPETGSKTKTTIVNGTVEDLTDGDLGGMTDGIDF